MLIGEDREAGVYVISFPDLPGCLTMGETITEAVENSLDAKRCWFAAAIEDGCDIAEPEETA